MTTVAIIVASVAWVGLLLVWNRISSRPPRN